MVILNKSAGELLRQVQVAKLFDDDKYFVDMKLKAAPDEVLSAFRNLTSGSPDGTLKPSQIRDFLASFFEEPGKEFEQWTPPDWHDKPQFLSKLSDAKLRSWAEKLHSLWKSLGRKIRADVKDRPELYSQIYSPHPVIVPGGRFRELYYWDSYWVINGLLLYGFVPNGGRVYYERRSQPPFLTLMMESYYKATKDRDFLSAAMPILEREYRFWMQNRSVSVEKNGTLHVLNRYSVQVGQPRPESYTDDLELAEGLTEGAQESMWAELKAGAESGWDYSSRWFIDGRGDNGGTLKDTQPSHILPTDLNALLCRNEGTLASFYSILGDAAGAERFDHAQRARLRAVEAVLWDPERGVWLDHNLLTNSSHSAFYPSNLAPLWARCYSQPSMGERAQKYLQESGALQYPNGVPTSLSNSGQQWDLPNAWPPLQHMLIEGLWSLPSEKAKEVAFDLAQRWISTNWKAYLKYEAMFEKYDVNGDGKPGGGGEYEVQLGFGWTNGVALQLLDQFGDRLISGSAGLSFSFGVVVLCCALLAVS
ncbi:hypothetical protein SKAU_G00086840 [Synaphobranchus kaupii]|uniref:Trehalase n=1 Tax=Synaphobranchus kaupii TaxID=118154 RepID=A0A9Q1J625_SYNKA|nr:hypothetical protein SKAU_G00086840 [Synaphobranchus kaupii]